MEINKNQIYLGGRYFLGLGHYFIKFPKNIQFIDSEFQIRSREGLSLNLKVRVVYKLGTAQILQDISTELLNIYSNVGMNWEEIIKRITQQTFRDIMSAFTAKEIVTKREMITTVNIMNELKASFTPRHFTLIDVFLSEVEPPKEYLKSLIQVELANQKAEEIRYLYEGLKIEAKTNSTLAEIEQVIIDYESINSGVILTKAHSEVLKILPSTTLSLYNNLKTIKDKLKLYDTTARTAGSQLLTYYWTKLMQNAGNKKSIANLDLPENLKEN